MLTFCRRHIAVDMKCLKIRQVDTDTLIAISNEGSSGRYAAMECKNLFYAKFFNRVAQCNLVGNLPSMDRIATD